MEINLWTVALYNFTVIIFIVVFGTKLILRGFEHIVLEKQIKGSEEEYRRYGSFDVFMENLNHIARKFWISFYVLEFFLIIYFVFWGLLLYYRITII